MTSSIFRLKALSILSSTLLVMALLTLTFCGSAPSNSLAFEGEYPDVVTVELVDNEGAPYAIKAIEGQVCVWYKKGVSYKKAQNNIKNLGGEIVAQIPSNGYYLVKLPVDNVQVFFE